MQRHDMLKYPLIICYTVTITNFLIVLYFIYIIKNLWISMFKVLKERKKNQKGICSKSRKESSITNQFTLKMILKFNKYIDIISLYLIKSILNIFKNNYFTFKLEACVK